jgi:DNA-binding NarL/FixJ family response regulator
LTEHQIRVLIVDDHPLFRQGVRLFLKGAPGIQLAGEAGAGEEALKFLKQETVDVVLLDLLMPGPDGIETARRILAEWPAVRVLIITSFGSWQKAFAALKTGASGYVLKDAEPEELLAAIRAVAAGGSYLNAGIAAQLLNHINSSGETEPEQPEPLTEREKEVLAQVARGLGNREIADKLFLSEKTVKTHVANILQKLNVKSRTQAALHAMKTGLVKETGNSET